MKLGREMEHASAEHVELTLQLRVRRCLDEWGSTSLGEIHVTVDDASVTLEGISSSFYHKQVAQELVKHVPGVRHVINLIQVVQGPKMPSE